jgi:four helix bundle protein
MRRTSSDKPFTLRKAIELTEDIGRICDRLPEQERDVLGSEMSRYAYLIVGRLSTALDATTAARRYRSYSAARGAVTALASLLDIATRVRAITPADVERSLITCDELSHMLKDLAGTPDW